MTPSDQFEVLSEQRKDCQEHWEFLLKRQRQLRNQSLEAEQIVLSVKEVRDLTELIFDAEINDDRSRGKHNGQRWTNEESRKSAKRQMQLASDEWKAANAAVQEAEKGIKRLKNDLADVNDDLERTKYALKSIISEIYAITAFQQQETAQVDDARLRFVLQDKQRLSSASATKN